MTRGELKRALKSAGDDSEIRIASIGHRTNLQYEVDVAAEVEFPDDSPGTLPNDTKCVVYLGEGG